MAILSSADEPCECRQQLTAQSHEVRTALQAIRLIADELSRSGLDDHQRQLVASLEVAADDALATVNGQLLPTSEDRAFSGSNANCAGALVAKQVAITWPAAEAKGLRLNVTLPPFGSLEPILATFCAEALTLIARNLISNAVAYTPAGQVTVSCRLSDHLSLEVADTGVGFPPSDCERIFNEGVRLHPRGCSDAGGFGLALARRAAVACGGSITARSGGLRGAVFTATLPLGPKGLVLLADDARSIRELLTMQLTGEGYAVVAAADGGAALAAAKARRFSAIILDGEMPVMSGSQTAFAIRSYFRGLAAPCPPLIALSGGVGTPFDEGIWCQIWRKPVSGAEIAAGLAQIAGS